MAHSNFLAQSPTFLWNHFSHWYFEGDIAIQPNSLCAFITSGMSTRAHERAFFFFFFLEPRWAARCFSDPFWIWVWSAGKMALLSSNKVHGISMHNAVLKIGLPQCVTLCACDGLSLPFLSQLIVYWVLSTFFFFVLRAFKYKILIRNTDRSGAWSTALHPSQKERERARDTCFLISLLPHLNLPPSSPFPRPPRSWRERRTWAAGAILLCTEKQLGSILDEWGVH